MSDEAARAAGEVGAEVGLGRPDADLARVFEDEALRVVRAGEQKGIPLRIIGALAFHHHCPQFGWIQAKLNRVYTDIDFAVTARCSQTRARTGRLTLPHATAETPVFMPVGTQASVKTLSPQDLRDIGAEIILSNTYHLWLRPGEVLVL